ncbi:hypothetical protein NQ317_014269, partial [Molorchus minor]
ARKLFGGYRITPRLCKPSRSLEEAGRSSSVCMFNHECIQRNGNVVGACMDGFLFGACCQLPAKEATGELLSSDINPWLGPVPSAWVTNKPETTSSFDITSNGVSQITAALLNPNILPTAQDNAIVQVNHEEPPYFSTTGTPKFYYHQKSSADNNNKADYVCKRKARDEHETNHTTSNNKKDDNEKTYYNSNEKTNDNHYKEANH